MGHRRRALLGRADRPHAAERNLRLLGFFFGFLSTFAMLGLRLFAIRDRLRYGLVDLPEAFARRVEPGDELPQGTFEGDQRPKVRVTARGCSREQQRQGWDLDIAADGVLTRIASTEMAGIRRAYVTADFEVEGFPLIDRGKAHILSLEETMYRPSKGRIDEALEYLDRGLKAAREMRERYAAVEAQVTDAALAVQIREELAQTYCLVETNNRYIRASYAYFQYRETPDEARRAALDAAVTALKDARARFVATPDFAYKLFGIDALLTAADAMLADREAAERALAKTPSTA